MDRIYRDIRNVQGGDANFVDTFPSGFSRYVSGGVLMATNAISLRRPSDRNLYLIAAISFPLLVLIGYFKTYYGRGLFDGVPALPTATHIHGLVMSAWVIYFVAQVALVRSKNIKLHMTMGFAGIGLAALAVVSGLAAAYYANLIELRAPPGLNPHSFFLIPAGDMLLFVIFFAGAIYYRKKPLQHKSLMLMTAINFVPPALARIPLGPPEFTILWAFGGSALLGLAALGWQRYKHGKFNWVFAGALGLFIFALPFRMWFSGTEMWLNFAGWLAS
jgi:hypothetical protein